MDEPRRDSSGYRRYGSAELLRLVQIRTLAAAGVPLAEIGAILDADPDRFAAALVDVERRLTDRIDVLLARRDTLRRLATGDRALLPDRVLAKLDRVAADLGFTPARRTRRRHGRPLPRPSLAAADPGRTPGPHRRRDSVQSAQPPRTRAEAGLGSAG
ncbi:MerR family transcriptional regulator [Nonomuraea angiospora]|uniref:MerR family transcriptional regulator n=1 Tax=Nonomuraea angiospora TaxID=46172 RepID=UPI00342925E7